MGLAAARLQAACPERPSGGGCAHPLHPRGSREADLGTSPGGREPRARSLVGVLQRCGERRFGRSPRSRAGRREAEPETRRGPLPERGESRFASSVLILEGSYMVGKGPH